MEELSIAASVPPPKVHIIDNHKINASATGDYPQHVSITVTTGSLQKLNRGELEGVVAHKMSHARNRNVAFMKYVAVLAGIWSILIYVIFMGAKFGAISGGRGLGKGREGRSCLEAIFYLLGLILAILAPLAVALIEFAISRKREFLADASSAELTRYPEGLASAFEKIGKINQREIKVDEAVIPLFINDPDKSGLSNLFATHPSLEEHIKRLRQMQLNPDFQVILEEDFCARGEHNSQRNNTENMLTLEDS